MDGAAALSPRRRQITVPGRGPGAISALELGPEGRAVDILFLHANGFNAQTYVSILSPLAGAARILLVDQRGHGFTSLTTETEGRTAWFEFRDDLLALLQALDLHDVVLSGHSMGGTAAIMAAADAPERVRRLVLFDPVMVPRNMQKTPESMPRSPLVEGALRRRAVFPNREAAIEAYRGRGAFKTWTEEMLADYVAGGFKDLPSGEVTLACEPRWEASNFTSHQHDSWGALERVVCPVDIFRAEVASTFQAEGREAEITASGRISLETIAGTSHFLPMERPDIVQAALRKALG